MSAANARLPLCSTPSLPACRHCAAPQCKRLRRGLCWKCHENVAIRSQYGHTSRYSPLFADFYGGYRLPAASTRALPGTKEKMAVLEARAAAGTALWHPGDVCIFRGLPSETVTIAGQVRVLAMLQPQDDDSEDLPDD